MLCAAHASHADAWVALERALGERVGVLEQLHAKVGADAAATAAPPTAATPRGGGAAEACAGRA